VMEMDPGALAFMLFAWGSIFAMMYWSITKLLEAEKRSKGKA